MNYTLEQKREALAKGELWWRFPNADYASDAEWTNEADMAVRSPTAEYFIGPTPPRVLSELEGELLEALKYARRFLKPEDHDCAFVDAAIQKAESTP